MGACGKQKRRPHGPRVLVVVTQPGWVLGTKFQSSEWTQSTFICGTIALASYELISASQNLTPSAVHSLMTPTFLWGLSSVHQFFLCLLPYFYSLFWLWPGYSLSAEMATFLHLLVSLSQNTRDDYGKIKEMMGVYYSQLQTLGIPRQVHQQCVSLSPLLSQQCHLNVASFTGKEPSVITEKSKSKQLN